MSRCINCGRRLFGKFCHECGEKIITTKDFSIQRVISDAFASIFNFDSRFYKSMRLLLTKPGLLTTEYIRGHRIPYMKPFQLFLICTLFFYVLFSSVDIFLIPSQWYFNSDQESVEGVRQLAKKIADKWNLTDDELTILYDSRVGTNSKLFIFILIPIIALGSLLIGYTSHKQYGIHIVHAIHLFTFMLVCFLAMYVILSILPGNYSGIYILLPLALILSIYFTLSIKQIFRFGWLRSIISSLILVGIVLIASGMFRNLISYTTLKSLEYSFFMNGFYHSQ